MIVCTNTTTDTILCLEMDVESTEVEMKEPYEGIQTVELNNTAAVCGIDEEVADTRTKEIFSNENHRLSIHNYDELSLGMNSNE